MENKFYECHCHIALDGADFEAATARHKNGVDMPYVRSVLEKYKAAGIEYVRDGGDKWGVAQAAGQICAEYGIEFATPVFPIYKKGNYGGFLGRGYSTMAEYAALVKEAADKGADFIKIMASGIMDFDRFGVLTGYVLEEKELKEAVKIAHDMGFPVMCHVNSADGVKTAVSAGVDSIEHGNYIDDAAIADMASSGCVFTPTVAAVADLIGLGFNDGVLEKIFAVQKQNLVKCKAAGVIIAPGSDAGTKGVTHCNGIQDEVRFISSVLGGYEELKIGQERIRKVFAKRRS